MAGSRNIRLAVRVDGVREACGTGFTSLCDRSVVLHTTLPAARLQVASTSEYLGHQDCSARASHLISAARAGGRAAAYSIEHPPGTLDVRGTPRACLYDHLHRLQAFLEDLGHALAVEVGDDALEALEGLTAPSSEPGRPQQRVRALLPLALLGAGWHL